ncbi:MAG: trypsin-like peptidase domain-containing protein [Candidatus Woesebacteria bacterium]|jgi:S1-C subfamily serine protease
MPSNKTSKTKVKTKKRKTSTKTRKKKSISKVKKGTKKTSIASFCPDCGTKLTKTAKFCSGCGEKIASITSNSEKSRNKQTFSLFKTVIHYFERIKQIDRKVAIAIVVMIGILCIGIGHKLGVTDRIIIATRQCSITNSSEKALNSVVKITTDMNSGSGFFVDETHIVTNNHVMEGVKEANITLGTGKLTKAKIIGSDEEADIAVLEIDDEIKPEYLKWAEVKEKVASDIVAIGFPLSDEESLKGDATVTKGTISAYRDGLYGIQYIQTDTSINPGNSGGPLLNECGEVIGVNDLYFNPIGSADPIFYAINTKSAKKAVEKILKDPSYSEPVGTLPRFEDNIEPTDVVMAYYQGLTEGSYMMSYQLFTIGRQKEWKPEEWQNLFTNVLSIEVKNIQQISTDPVKVKAEMDLYTTDGVNLLVKTADSIWTLKYSLGRLALDDVEIEYGEEKAIFNQDYEDAIRFNKSLADTVYPAILNKDMSYYPQQQVVIIKALIEENTEIINRLFQKVTNGEPLDESEFYDNDLFVSNHDQILDINKEFESIDLQNYYLNYYSE